MTKVTIAENFYGKDPMDTGRPFEMTLAHQPEQKVQAPEQSTLESDEVVDVAALRAKHILDGLKISFKAHATPKVLEHQDEDIRTDLFNPSDQLTQKR